MVVTAVNKKRLSVLVCDHRCVAGVLCSQIDRSNDHLAASGIRGQFQTTRQYRYYYSKRQKMQECASSFIGTVFFCFHFDQLPSVGQLMRLA